MYASYIEHWTESLHNIFVCWLHFVASRASTKRSTQSFSIGIEICKLVWFKEHIKHKIRKLCDIFTILQKNQKKSFGSFLWLSHSPHIICVCVLCVLCECAGVIRNGMALCWFLNLQKNYYHFHDYYYVRLYKWAVNKPNGFLFLVELKSQNLYLAVRDDQIHCVAVWMMMMMIHKVRRFQLATTSKRLVNGDRVRASVNLCLFSIFMYFGFLLPPHKIEYIESDEFRRVGIRVSNRRPRTSQHNRLYLST